MGMGVAPGGGGAASVAELRSYANLELFTQWGYRSWKTNIMEMKLVNVGVLLQIYANVAEDDMTIISYL
jgi:hypothetical protein